MIPNTSEHKGGVGVPLKFISKTGTYAMICSGLGLKVVQMFEEFGINVFVGAEGTVARCDRGMAAGTAYGSDRRERV